MTDSRWSASLTARADLDGAPAGGAQRHESVDGGQRDNGAFVPGMKRKSQVRTENRAERSTGRRERVVNVWPRALLLDQARGLQPPQPLGQDVGPLDSPQDFGLN